MTLHKEKWLASFVNLHKNVIGILLSTNIQSNFQISSLKFWGEAGNLN